MGVSGMTGYDYWKIYKKINTHKIGLDLDYGIEVIDGKVCLCFDGSNSLIDWKENLNFPVCVYKKQVSEMKMHRGYVKIWKSGNDQIMSELIEACELNQCVEPIIVGHSLGGALALFAAEDFNFRTGRSAKVVTFGAPKACGNKWTSQYINICAGITEFEQKMDIVPACPPLPWFRHVAPKKIGKFNFWKMWNVAQNHQNYGNKDDYSDELS